jgi:hypothetical protein
MILREPFCISARLLPALRVEGAWIQLEPDGWSKDRRQVFRWTIDLPGVKGSDDGGFSAADLRSGVGGGASLQQMFATLLGFLSACGESVRYADRTGREGENADLFPRQVARWAAQHADELAMLECVLEEEEGLIDEG